MGQKAQQHLSPPSVSSSSSSSPRSFQPQSQSHPSARRTISIMRGFLFRLRGISEAASMSSYFLGSARAALRKEWLFCFSTDSEGSSRLKIFDRDLKRKQV